MSPPTSIFNAVHHGQLSPRQRELLTALLLNRAACSSGRRWCPEMAQVQAAYTELLAAGSADQHHHSHATGS